MEFMRNSIHSICLKSSIRPGPLLLALTVSAWLAGCADMGGIAPHAHMADPNSLGAGKDVQAAAASPANWPTAQWWQAYQDPQLNALVEKAVAGSPSVKLAAARVDEAQALAGIVHSASLPQVGGRVGLGRIRYSEQDFIPPPYAGSYTWTNSAFLSASYDLDLWGKESGRESGALDAVHASEAEQQEARVALQSLVVHAYVDLALQYELRDIEQRTLAQQQQIVEIANRRRAIGLGTQLEVSQAEAPVPVTQAHLKQADEQIESLQHQLAALCGAGPAAGDTITRPAVSAVARIGLPSSLPAELIGHRPDVVANRWRVEASARGIDVAKTEFYPNVDLTALFGFQSLGFPGFLSNASRMDGITPAISLPIFTGGKLRSNLAVQTARYDQAVERYNQSVIDAMRGVADQVSLWRSLEQQQQDTQRAVELAQRSYDLAMRGYKSGLTEYINVLSAQVNLLNQQQNDAKVRFGQLGAYAGLVRTLGGGIEPEIASKIASESAP
jgi:NodT family efflux transporter outer membrane factor (OMF) lipoprotein